MLWLPACADTRPTHTASETCALKTPAAWQGFLERAADDAAWLKTCDSDDCETAAGEFARHIQSDLLDVVAQCEPDLHDNPTIAACTDRLRRFIHGCPT